MLINIKHRANDFKAHSYRRMSMHIVRVLKFSNIHALTNIKTIKFNIRLQLSTNIRNNGTKLNTKKCTVTKAAIVGTVTVDS